MDFGEVLDEWEKKEREHKDSSPKPATRVLEEWLSTNGVRDKDDEADAALDPAERGREARRLAGLKPQAVLDLHGMTGVEAESAIADFVYSSSRSGLEKVLVIHGKGLHSAGAPVLKKAARRAIEAHPMAGRFGEADKADGGSGALWVLIRSRVSG
jgi:DNA-nicking Smr family endonuclease